DWFLFGGRGGGLRQRQSRRIFGRRSGGTAVTARGGHEPRQGQDLQRKTPTGHLLGAGGVSRVLRHGIGPPEISRDRTEKRHHFFTRRGASLEQEGPAIGRHV